MAIASKTKITTPLPDDLTSVTPQPSVTAKRKGRIPKGLKSNIVKQIIECNKTLQHPTQQNIADETGVCRQTVANVLDKYGINKQELDQFVDNRVDIVRSKQQLILDNITPAKIQTATFKDLAVGYGILLDKDRLESGQSTSNMASWTKVVQVSQAVDLATGKGVPA